jgi:hypothetical protein
VLSESISHPRRVQNSLVLRQTKFETTAAEAERAAPNHSVAHEVGQNAEQAQDVTKQAALAAHVSSG